jgi:alkaline phosphatase D
MMTYSLFRANLMAFTRRTFSRTLTGGGLAAALVGRAPAQTAGSFRHGIASGDPLDDRFIIWTRITPSTP